jgi:hypothetical protein
MWSDFVHSKYTIRRLLRRIFFFWALTSENLCQAAPVLGEAPPQEECFREYRAFGAEEEPWKEEVFAQELAVPILKSIWCTDFL